MQLDLKSAIDSYSLWMREQAIPLWATKGIDPYGASYERLLANGQPDCSVDKRIRVQARQMFSFSYAQHRGWIDNGEHLVRQLAAFVEKYARQDKSQIYAHVLSADNQVVNSNQDLYDCAFFLLAYAWRYRVFNDAQALDKADALLQQINLDLKQYPLGWSEGDYDTPYRRQNPHMHLFEAFIALYQSTKDGKYLAKAGEIFCLFEACFFDRQQGVLLEYFDMNWQPQRQAGELAVEPGHMLEWVWLLRQYEKLTETPVEDYCNSLYHNSIRFGLDTQTGLLFDEVNEQGKVLKATKRCWPLTEWVKASLVQSEMAQDKQSYDYTADASKALSALLKRYRSGQQYIDQIGENDEIISDMAPASTLYHLLMAEAETSRYINDQ